MHVCAKQPLACNVEKSCAGFNDQHVPCLHPGCPQVHLDDGRQQNGWRNTIPFDPLWPYRLGRRCIERVTVRSAGYGQVTTC